MFRLPPVLQRRCGPVGGASDGHQTQALEHSGVWAVAGEALALAIDSVALFISPSHGINSGAHGEAYSKHTGASSDRRLSATTRLSDGVGAPEPPSEHGFKG